MYNPDDYISSKIDIEDELRVMLLPEKVKAVFDIGACEGEDSIRYARFFPNAQVYAFEPRADNCERAISNIKKYNVERIRIENIALSDKEGMADFFLSEGKPENIEASADWDFGNKSSSLLAPSDEIFRHIDWLKFRAPVKVPTTTLHQFLAKEKIEIIDLAHIDVQGAELLVLKGAGEKIQNIRLVWMEVENVALYKSQALKNEVEIFMESHGFRNILDTVGEITGDQLYANTRYFSNWNFFRIRLLRVKKNLFTRLNFFKKIR